MWKITIVANTLIMWVFGLASLFGTEKLHNHYGRYSSASLGVELPWYSGTALSVRWLWFVVPIAWVGIGMITAQFIKKRPESASAFVQLHTSATILVGLIILTFFAAAGYFPFADIKCGLAP